LTFSAHLLGRKSCLLGKQFGRIVIAHVSRMDAGVDDHAGRPEFRAREIAETIEVLRIQAQFVRHRLGIQRPALSES